MDTYGTLENVSIITMAPEKDPTGQTIKKLTDMGITVSCGHSMGNLKDGEDAVRNGASLITHLFNAMLPVGNVFGILHSQTKNHRMQSNDRAIFENALLTLTESALSVLVLHLCYLL